jgi:hypothetical protein
MQGEQEGGDGVSGFHGVSVQPIENQGENEEYPSLFEFTRLKNQPHVSHPRLWLRLPAPYVQRACTVESLTMPGT